MVGRWPDQIDHRNGDQLDDRWDNLREATCSQNQANRSAHKDNKTGFKGVYFHAGKYTAMIMRNGVHRYLGRFDSAQDAHTAYANVAQQIDGEFFRP
jgi:hypothetical protein